MGKPQMKLVTSHIPSSSFGSGFDSGFARCRSGVRTVRRRLSANDSHGQRLKFTRSAPSLNKFLWAPGIRHQASGAGRLGI